MPSSKRVGAAGLLVALLPVTVSAVSYNYTLQDTYAGANFYDGFNFFTDPDPTHGFVEYVDKTTAMNSGILGFGQGTAKWGVDDTNVLYANSTGRQSVRLEGNVNYNHGLFLADIKHMPGSICGVWPAFWTLGDSNWPAHGELDIIEGVNTFTTNQIAAHTAPNCTMTFQDQSGWVNGRDCAVSTGGAAGCATGTNDQTGYGDGFNANGGGVYAMQWTSEFMKVWFFPRNGIPASITSGSPSPALDFGTPVGNFDGGSCDIDSHFINHRMIFDTTFCGDWAGSVYDQTSCPMASGGASGCVNYVAQNPKAFSEAYWEVNYIKVFSETVIASPSSSSSSSSVSSTSSSSSSSISSVSSTSSTFSSSSLSTSSSKSSSTSVFPSSTSSARSSSTSVSSILSSSVRPSSTSTSSSSIKPSTSTSASSSSVRASSSSSSIKPTTSSSSVKPTTSSSSIKPTTSSSSSKPASTSSTKPISTSSTVKPSSTSSTKPVSTSSTVKPTTSSSTIKPSTSSKAPTTSSTSSRKTSTSSSSVKTVVTLSTKKAGVSQESHFDEQYEESYFNEQLKEGHINQQLKEGVFYEQREESDIDQQLKEGHFNKHEKNQHLLVDQEILIIDQETQLHDENQHNQNNEYEAHLECHFFVPLFHLIWT
ncbi:hypothetical protein D6C89_05190 [Aureobasidium pullulans]|nr:hypothetical protein D6C89_05190 [Aureobasidium pullulans]